MNSFRLAVIVVVLALSTASAAQARPDAPVTLRVRDSGNAAQLGRWSVPFWEGPAGAFDPPSSRIAKKFPTAVSVVVLPDGRLLYWNGAEGYEDGTVTGFDENGQFQGQNSRARILDLRSGHAHWTIPKRERGTTENAYDHHGADGSRASTKDLFCSDHKLLYDGTVLIAGGTEVHQLEDVMGDDETRIFDPETNSFSSVEAMREPRWYPSLVTLPDGRVLVVSGVRRLGTSFTYGEPGFSQVRLNEIYDPATRRWRDAGTGEWTLPLYPRLHLLPDGAVFYGGAGEFWSPFGETGDAATWAVQRTYDPETMKWTLGGASSYGGRSGASSTLLRLEPPYDEAQILIAGGTLGVTPGSVAATTLSEVVRWTRAGGIENDDVTSPVAGLAGDESQLRNRRWHGSSTLLPTGEVLLFNGGDTDDAVDPGSAAAVRTPELYDPKTGTWTELASSQRERIYHSSAALLPDGRVLVGGHAPLPTHYTNYENPVARANNHRDATFEIYEPPYLFRGPRPKIAGVAPAAGGRELRLTLEKGTHAGDISEIVLVRLQSNTHAMDSDMRAVKLRHGVAGSNLFAELPRGGDGRILPPGPYYVFALRDTKDGAVPSVAHVVLIRPRANGKVVAREL